MFMFAITTLYKLFTLSGILCIPFIFCFNGNFDKRRKTNKFYSNSKWKVNYYLKESCKRQLKYWKMWKGRRCMVVIVIVILIWLVWSSSWWIMAVFNIFDDACMVALMMISLMIKLMLMLMVSCLERYEHILTSWNETVKRTTILKTIINFNKNEEKWLG